MARAQGAPVWHVYVGVASLVPYSCYACMYGRRIIIARRHQLQHADVSHTPPHTTPHMHSPRRRMSPSKGTTCTCTEGSPRAPLSGAASHVSTLATCPQSTVQPRVQPGQAKFRPLKPSRPSPRQPPSRSPPELRWSCRASCCLYPAPRAACCTRAQTEVAPRRPGASSPVNEWSGVKWSEVSGVE